MNSTQRRLHSYRQGRPAPAVATPALVRGAIVSGDRDRAVVRIRRSGFEAEISIPRRPRGWVIAAGQAPAGLESSDYGVVAVEPATAEAVAAARRWLAGLPEARGLPVAVAGGAEGLAATAELGLAVDALILEREAEGPLAMVPTLVLAEDPAASVEGFLDRELCAPRAPALNHRQRRLLARGLARGMSGDLRGGARAGLRAGIATLAAALALTLSLAAGAPPAEAAVTQGWSSLTGALTVESDGAADGITVECNTATNPPDAEVNGVTLAGGQSPPFDIDSDLNCHESTTLLVTGNGGADTIDLTDVTNDGDAVLDDFTNLTGGDVTAEGNNGADSIEGTGDIRQLLAGQDGNDTLAGGSAGDSLRGGADDDSLTGLGGSDTVDYSLAVGPVDVDLFAGTATGQGIDTVSAENAIGTAANDTLAAAAASASLVGGLGDDSLLGNAGADDLFGDAGADFLSGGTNPDSLDGGSENDTLDGGLALDTLDGQGGSDLAGFTAATGPVTIDLGAQSVTGAETDEIDEIEQATGSGFADSLLGSATAADTLLGGNGADSIEGLNFSDSLSGDGGGDSVNGSFSADTVLGGLANDTLQGDQHPSLAGGGSNDSIDGGGGTGDRLLAHVAANDPLNRIQLSDTQVLGSGTDQLGNVEQAVLEGDDDPNVLAASDGLNLGTEFSGEVTITGGLGNDTLRGGLGADSLAGGSGTNQVDQFANSSQTLTATQLTGMGTDTLSAVGQASLRSSTGDDLLDASAFTGPTSLAGAQGEDTLEGGTNADFLDASSGEDSLEGDLGNDTLRPGTIGLLTSTETVGGGGGNDTLDYSSIAGPVNVNLATGLTNKGGTEVDSLSLLENVIGTSDPGLPEPGDTITGDSSPNELSGGVDSGDQQSDRIVQSASGTQLLADTLLTGAGPDTIEAFEQASLSGGAGADIIDASSWTADGVTLAGLAGADSLHGSGAADSLVGAAGDDTLEPDGGGDSLDGGTETDRVVQTVDADQSLADTQLTGLGTDSLLQIETASLTGGAAANLISAGGFTGSVTLDGQGGGDSLVGTAAADSLLGQGEDDILQGREGADNLDGGAGTNTADYSDDPGGVAVQANLATGLVQGDSTDTLASVANLNGTSLGDLLTGNAAANTLAGSDGPDTITAGAGEDSLQGGTGNDIHNSQDGGTADTNDCGADTDTANADVQDTTANCETVNNPAAGQPGGPPVQPPPAPPTPPATPDTKAPDLGLSGKAKQKDKKQVKVDVSCDEACTVEAGGTIKVPEIKGKGKVALKSKKFELKRATASLAANQTQTLKLKLSGKAKKLLKKAIKTKKSTAKVNATATDAAGNAASSPTLKIKVKK